MSAPLPSALRTRFRKYIEEGLSGRAAAARLRVSPATGARWARQIRTRGHADPAVQGRPPGSGKLSPHRAFMEELVAQDPDITLFELRDALAEAEGVEVHHSSIARLLTRLGFTYKRSRWSPPNAAAQGQGNSAPTGSGIACLRSPPRPTAWSFRTRRR